MTSLNALLELIIKERIEHFPANAGFGFELPFSLERCLIPRSAGPPETKNKYPTIIKRMVFRKMKNIGRKFL